MEGKSPFEAIASAYNARATKLAKLACAREQRACKKREEKDQRRASLERMLAAEGIAADGVYFEECVQGTRIPDMAEFRFRHYIATDGSKEYERIINGLKDDGHYYAGIHADARHEFKARLAKSGISFDSRID